MQTKGGSHEGRGTIRCLDNLFVHLFCCVRVKFQNSPVQKLPPTKEKYSQGKEHVHFEKTISEAEYTFFFQKYAHRYILKK